MGGGALLLLLLLLLLLAVLAGSGATIGAAGAGSTDETTGASSLGPRRVKAEPPSDLIMPPGLDEDRANAELPGVVASAEVPGEALSLTRCRLARSMTELVTALRNGKLWSSSCSNSDVSHTIHIASTTRRTIGWAAGNSRGCLQSEWHVLSRGGSHDGRFPRVTGGSHPLRDLCSASRIWSVCESQSRGEREARPSECQPRAATTRPPGAPALGQPRQLVPFRRHEMPLDGSHRVLVGGLGGPLPVAIRTRIRQTEHPTRLMADFGATPLRTAAPTARPAAHIVIPMPL
jgi:hypothetical protein